MIEQIQFEGRPATVAYLTRDWKPATEADHEMLRVLFEDDEGGSLTALRQEPEGAQDADWLRADGSVPAQDVAWVDTATTISEKTARDVLRLDRLSHAESSSARLGRASSRQAMLEAADDDIGSLLGADVWQESQHPRGASGPGHSSGEFAKKAGGGYKNILSGKGYQKQASPAGTQVYTHPSGAKVEINTKNGTWTSEAPGKRVKKGKLTKALAAMFGGEAEEPELAKNPVPPGVKATKPEPVALPDGVPPGYTAQETTPAKALYFTAEPPAHGPAPGKQIILADGVTLYTSDTTDHWALSPKAGGFIDGKGQADLDKALKEHAPELATTPKPKPVTIPTGIQGVSLKPATGVWSHTLPDANGQPTSAAEYQLDGLLNNHGEIPQSTTLEIAHEDGPTAGQWAIVQGHTLLAKGQGQKQLDAAYEALGGPAEALKAPPGMAEMSPNNKAYSVIDIHSNVLDGGANMLNIGPTQESPAGTYVHIGKDGDAKGKWQMVGPLGHTIAKGQGQAALNAAFEALHPRGPGGQFAAKPKGPEGEQHPDPDVNAVLGAAGAVFDTFGSKKTGSSLIYKFPNGAKVTLVDGPNPNFGVVGPNGEPHGPGNLHGAAALTKYLTEAGVAWNEMPQIAVKHPIETIDYALKASGFQPTLDGGEWVQYVDANSNMVTIAKEPSGGFGGSYNWSLAPADGKQQSGSGFFDNLLPAIKALQQSGVSTPAPGGKAEGAELAQMLGTKGYKPSEAEYETFWLFRKPSEGLYAPSAIYIYKAVQPNGVHKWLFYPEDGGPAQAGESLSDLMATLGGSTKVPQPAKKGSYSALLSPKGYVVSHPESGIAVWTHPNGAKVTINTKNGTWVSEVPGKRTHKGKLTPKLAALLGEPVATPTVTPPEGHPNGTLWLPTIAEPTGTQMAAYFEVSDAEHSAGTYLADVYNLPDGQRLYVVAETGGWFITAPSKGKIAEGMGQVTLNAAFEKLHPRGPGGQFAEKPGEVIVAKPAQMPASSKPKVATKALKKIAEQKGSNEGGVYQDADGNKFYMKITPDEEHAKNERLAAALYSLAGASTLQYREAEDNPQAIITEWQELDHGHLSKMSAAEKKAARQDFAIHAWTANWDVPGGSGGDNIGATNGKPLTLDLGGSLLFRAQGAPKGEKFGYKADEWDTMRDPAKNPTGGELFGSMTPEELRQSAKKLEAVTDEQIFDAVKATGFSEAQMAQLVDKLEARRKDLIKRSLEPPKPKPPPPPPEKHPYKVHSDSHTWSATYKERLGKAPTPTQAEAKAITTYSGPGSSWNQELRTSSGFNSGHYPQEALAGWLRKANWDEDGAVITRRLGGEYANYLMAEASEGVHEYTDHGFASGDHWSGGLTLRIKLPKGAQAAAIGYWSDHPTENEILIQAGSRFRMDAYDPVKHVAEVTLVRSGPAGKSWSIRHEKPTVEGAPLPLPTVQPPVGTDIQALKAASAMSEKELDKISDAAHDLGSTVLTGDLSHISEEGKAAVKHWTQPAGYKFLNDHLRGIATSEAAGKEAEALQKAITGHPLPQGINAWRGVHGPQADDINALKPGAVFTNPGFFGTTIDPKVATHYAKGKDLIHMVVPEGYPALYVSHVQLNPGWEKERELLLPHHTRFRYLGKEEVEMPSYDYTGNKTGGMKMFTIHRVEVLPPEVAAEAAD